MSVSSYLDTVSAPSPIRFVIKALVGSWLGMRQSNTKLPFRVLIALFIFIIFGIIGLGVSESLLRTNHYITQSTSLIVIYELLYAVKRHIFTLTPVLLLCLAYVFQKISVKVIIMISLLIVLLVSLPQFVDSWVKWRSLMSMLEGLQLREVTYERVVSERAPFAPSYNYAEVRFEISEDLFPGSYEKLQQMRSKLRSKLPRGDQEGLDYYSLFVHKQFADGDSTTPNWDKFYSQPGVIHGEVQLSFE